MNQALPQRRNTNDLLIGRIGVVRAGKDEGWFVKIEPSGESAFLILTSKTRDFRDECYDNWVEAENLPRYFVEAGWVIDWIDLEYDEPALVQQIEAFPKRFRTVFAAACAQRLFSSYCLYDRDGTLLNARSAGEMMDKVWDDILLDVVSLTKQDVEMCSEMVRAFRDNEGEGTIAEDAMAAISHTVRHHVGGDLHEVVYPARRITETIERYLEDIRKTDVRESDSKHLQSTHPLMQKELERQAWDLLDLREPAYDYMERTIPEVVAVRAKKARKEIERIRHRAIKDGSLMIEW